MKHHKSPVLAAAEETLQRIRNIKANIDALKKSAEIDMQEIKKRYRQELAPFLENFASAEKKLLNLMKKEKGEIFKDEERVALVNGILIYGREFKVSIPRNALERIEAKGWSEAIKIAKSIDREMVEGWPDERLFAIGATKKLMEIFSYETLANEKDIPPLWAIEEKEI